MGRMLDRTRTRADVQSDLCVFLWKDGRQRQRANLHVHIRIAKQKTYMQNKPIRTLGPLNDGIDFTISDVLNFKQKQKISNNKARPSAHMMSRYGDDQLLHTRRAYGILPSSIQHYRCAFWCPGVARSTNLCEISLFDRNTN